MKQSTSLGPEQALEQIDYMKALLAQSQRRVSNSYPYFLMWGAIWIVGYGCTPFLRDPAAEIMWAVLTIGGLTAGALIGRKQRGDVPASPMGKRVIWFNWITILMMYAVPCVTGFRGGNAMPAYFPFFIGFTFILNGLFAGWEMMAVGAWLVAASLFSLRLSGPLFFFWLAFAGGGGLFLTGILLRRQAILAKEGRLVR